MSDEARELHRIISASVREPIGNINANSFHAGEMARLQGGIGLWLRVRVERDRQLQVDLPGVAEPAAEPGLRRVRGGG